MANIIWRAQSPSTNTEIRDLQVPDWTVLVTGNQTAGRGRLQRTWITPPNTALAASVVVPVDAWQAAVSLAPLMAGSALKTAFDAHLPSHVKWPNDVLVAHGAHAGRKLAGVLCELLPTNKVIVGTGINLFTQPEDLPTERATSVLAAGGDIGAAAADPVISSEAGRAFAEDFLRRYIAELERLATLAQTAPAALLERLTVDAATVGSAVRIIGHDGSTREGTALAITPGGELTVELAKTGEIVTVSAADIEHLRETRLGYTESK